MQNKTDCIILKQIVFNNAAKIELIEMINVQNRELQRNITECLTDWEIGNRIEVNCFCVLVGTV